LAPAVKCPCAENGCRIGDGFGHHPAQRIEGVGDCVCVTIPARHLVADQVVSKALRGAVWILDLRQSAIRIEDVSGAVASAIRDHGLSIVAVIGIVDGVLAHTGCGSQTSKRIVGVVCGLTIGPNSLDAVADRIVAVARRAFDGSSDSLDPARQAAQGIVFNPGFDAKCVDGGGEAVGFVV